MVRKDKTGSIYKKGKDPVHPDAYRISADGNYFVNLKLPWYRKLWLFFDAIIFGLIYILVGFAFSWMLNKISEDYTENRVITEADPQWVVGFVIIGESLLNVFVLYILIQLIPRIFPNIYPNPPAEHDFFKQMIGNILLSFSLLAANYNIVKQLQYVFDTKDFAK